MGGDGAEAASVPFHDLAAEGEPVADRVRSRAFPAFLVGLRALNLLISFLTGGPAERRQVPYQPFFSHKAAF